MRKPEVDQLAHLHRDGERNGLSGDKHDDSSMGGASCSETESPYVVACSIIEVGNITYNLSESEMNRLRNALRVFRLPWPLRVTVGGLPHRAKMRPPPLVITVLTSSRQRFPPTLGRDQPATEAGREVD